MSTTCVTDDRLETTGTGSEYLIRILDQDFQGKVHEIHHASLTGRDVIRLAKRRPAKNFIVLRQLANGRMEELGLDQKLSIQEQSKDRFFVIKGDRTFRLMVDGYRLAWPKKELNGGQIRRLAQKDNDFEVWQELKEAPDKLIEETQNVSLSARGVESFYTKPRVKTVEVTYNHSPVTLEKRKYSFQELFQAFGVMAGYVLEQIHTNGEFEPLEPGDTIKIRKGLAFFSHAPEGQSS